MSKEALIEKIAAAGMTKKDAGNALKAVTDGITELLKEGQKISLIGFGTFEVRDRPERNGKNPRTGEPLKIAACKVPAFKAGKALKEAVN